MPKATLEKIIAAADAGGYCVPAFNVYNMETVIGVINAAEALRAPVILQVYPRLFNEQEGFYLSHIITAAAEKASVPVCFHLDHGPSESEAIKALSLGASGIMIDGSTLPIEENIALTRHIVDICGAAGVKVEGELGHIGSANDENTDDFTDPTEAREFAKKTGVCCLAVLVGNAHGHYKKPPRLDIERIKAIRAATGLPLVLHGGSGIPDDQVKSAICAGIRKMNVGTDVCCAFADGTLSSLQDPERSVAVDLFMKKAIESVKTLAEEKIKLVGADGKA